MGEQEAEDWLSVAVGEVLTYPAHIVTAAAAEARRTCTHHAQIVPTMIRYCEEFSPKPDPLVTAMADVPPLPRDTPRLPAPKITQAMVDSMSPELIRMGLTCGALVRDEDGNVIVNPE